MGERTIRDHLGFAVAIIIVGGISLGWVGGRAIDYTFKDVKENTMFRVQQIEENRYLEEKVQRLEEALTVLPALSETIIRIDERLQRWEPVNLQ